MFQTELNEQEGILGYTFTYSTSSCRIFPDSRSLRPHGVKSAEHFSLNCVTNGGTLTLFFLSMFLCSNVSVKIQNWYGWVDKID